MTTMIVDTQTGNSSNENEIKTLNQQEERKNEDLHAVFGVPYEIEGKGGRKRKEVKEDILFYQNSIKSELLKDCVKNQQDFRVDKARASIL